MSETELEFFGDDSETTVAFVAPAGAGGVLIHRKDAGWSFHPRGSAAWDGLHQEAYRNFKMDPLCAADLGKRGVPLPAPELYRGRPAMDWRANFSRQMDLAKAPERIQARLAGGEAQVFLVLSEDGYETSFGDGKYLYPDTAFWDLASARGFLEARQREAQDWKRAPDPPKAQWYRYSLKTVKLCVCGDQLFLEMEVGPYEHVDIEKVVRAFEAAERTSGLLAPGRKAAPKEAPGG